MLISAVGKGRLGWAAASAYWIPPGSSLWSTAVHKTSIFVELVCIKTSRPQPPAMLSSTLLSTWLELSLTLHRLHLQSQLIGLSIGDFVQIFK